MRARRPLVLYDEQLLEQRASMGDRLEATLAILNGLVGDHLARTANQLASRMTLVQGGRPLAAERSALALALPRATPRVVLLVHGLMTTENVWAWPDGSDYGQHLARDLGYTALYLRYNSGRAIGDNGVALAELLELLRVGYPQPIDELLLLGYSMGGLVIRSACHVAAQAELAWLPLVKRAIYVGTPHRGAPLERAAQAVMGLLHDINDPYTRLIADIANVRSAGLRDLGHAQPLREKLPDVSRESALRDPSHPVPLLNGIEHHLIAGMLHRERWLGELFGDALVPVSSATDGACSTRETFALPPEHVKLFAGLGHLELARSAAVYAAIRTFCAGAPTEEPWPTSPAGVD